MKITAFIPAALMIFGFGCVWLGDLDSTGDTSDSALRSPHREKSDRREWRKDRAGQEEAEQTATETSPAVEKSTSQTREEVEKTENRDRRRRGDVNRPGRKEADQASRENPPPRRKVVDKAGQEKADQASRENPPPRRKVVDKAGQEKADQGENSDQPIQKELDRPGRSRGK